MSGPQESHTLVSLSAADVRRAHPSSVVASSVEQHVVELFDQWRNPLRRYLLGFSLALHDSEDIIQETFLALFQHLRRGKPRQNLRGWLFRVAHNLALKKHQRSRQDSRSIVQSSITSENLFIDPAPNPEDQLAISQTQKRLKTVLQTLPEQSRRCLYLRAEGLRYREISEVLDISVGSVSLCLERSLAHIARAIKR
jgi:RNA polymerase sigma-70 factor (ECF subfamily)